MFEQLLQLKNRYHKMVNKTTLDDVQNWSADFFSQYPFVTHIRWHQLVVEGVLEVVNPELTVTPGFAATHPDVEWGVTEFDEIVIDDSPKLSLGTPLDKEMDQAAFKELRPAAEAMEKFLKAKDVMLHLFGADTFVYLTPTGIETDEVDDDVDS